MQPGTKMQPGGYYYVPQQPQQPVCQQQPGGSFVMFVNGQAQQGGSYATTPQNCNFVQPLNNLQLNPWFTYNNCQQQQGYYYNNQQQPGTSINYYFDPTTALSTWPAGADYYNYNNYYQQQQQNYYKAPTVASQQYYPQQYQHGTSVKLPASSQHQQHHHHHKAPTGTTSSAPSTGPPPGSLPPRPPVSTTPGTTGANQQVPPLQHTGGDEDAADAEIAAINNGATVPTASSSNIQRPSEPPPTGTMTTTTSSGGDDGASRKKSPSVKGPNKPKPNRNGKNGRANSEAGPAPSIDNSTSLAAALGGIAPELVEPKPKPVPPVIQVRLPDKVYDRCCDCYRHRNPACMRPVAITLAIISLFVAPPFMSIPAIIFACKKQNLSPSTNLYQLERRRSTYRTSLILSILGIILGITAIVTAVVVFRLRDPNMYVKSDIRYSVRGFDGTATCWCSNYFASECQCQVEHGKIYPNCHCNGNVCDCPGWSGFIKV